MKLITTASFGAILCLLSTSALAADVPKEQFLNQMTATMGATLCKPDQVFRKCNTLQENECQEIAQTVIKACTKELSSKIPAKVAASDAKTWGGKIATCAGGHYFTELVKQRGDRTDGACLKAMGKK